MVVVLLCASGCVSEDGVELDVVPSHLLERSARSGDKQAQLALGIRYELGLGVPRDLGRATELYRSAAAPTSREQFVYSPSTRAGTAGRVIRLDGVTEPGLPEAALRLRTLENLKD